MLDYFACSLLSFSFHDNRLETVLCMSSLLKQVKSLEKIMQLSVNYALKHNTVVEVQTPHSVPELIQSGTNSSKSTLKQVSTKEPVPRMQVRLTKPSPKLIVLRLSVVDLPRLSQPQLSLWTSWCYRLHCSTGRLKLLLEKKALQELCFLQIKICNTVGHNQTYRH